MEFSEDIWADWRATKQEQFGQDRPAVTLILNELARHGIHPLRGPIHSTAEAASRKALL